MKWRVLRGEVLVGDAVGLALASDTADANWAVDASEAILIPPLSVRTTPDAQDTKEPAFRAAAKLPLVVSEPDCTSPGWD
mmetsp:Transcript_68899/g.128634  ORF Transcript_68899/g.128634 Transcript_68899/m.128634 type:complete len:80 (+) Transcript_68899:237-476(+)